MVVFSNTNTEKRTKKKKKKRKKKERENVATTMAQRGFTFLENLQGETFIYLFIYNNIWHLHSLSIDESQSYVQETRVSLKYTVA